MRWLVLPLLVLGACGFFDTDNHSGHRAPDAAIGTCAGMVFTGQACTTEPPCIWSEGVDGGIPSPQSCTCGNGHWTCVDACPAQPPGGECAPLELGCAYPESNGLTLTCACTSTGWRCSDCPFDFNAPGATCTPGLTCNYEDWEHGCSCACSSAGHWGCVNETIGSMCPGSTIDAGI